MKTLRRLLFNTLLWLARRTSRPRAAGGGALEIPDEIRQGLLRQLDAVARRLDPFRELAPGKGRRMAFSPRRLGFFPRREVRRAEWLVRRARPFVRRGWPLIGRARREARRA